MRPAHNKDGDSPEKLLSSVLPEYLCRALPYRSLNKMQAECLQTWESDVNMLIAAPTGAGKTLCFELAILRVLHQTGEIPGEKCSTPKGLPGKIVYIAPTKSLCSERVRDWKQKFQCLGLRVQAVTGDVVSSSVDTILRNTDLVAATAEKWDSMTRNLGSKTPAELSAQIRLLLLDEVHQVGDSRGAVFESVVTRMLIACDASSTQASSGGRALPAASLRIIAVSATVENASDIGRWLRVSELNMKVFDETYRPVALDYHVLGYTARNPWLYGKVYDNNILKVITKYGEGKPCIVFCTSRRQTVTSAEALLNKLCGKGSSLAKDGNPFLRSLSAEQKSCLISSAYQCNHSLLTSLLPHGIAIHNADMNARSRNLVESMFRDSLIGCLFSTSTLAQGVNLPARLVVIAGTTVYNKGCLEEYQHNLLLQMCGRAGRPGLDSKGVVVIMTASPNVAGYNNIRSNASNKISSQLFESIAESINAEVARQVITDVPSAISFLSCTLLWKQLSTSSVEDVRTSDSNEELGLHSIAVKAINELCDTNLVQYDADHFGLSCTPAGMLMARYCLSVETMRLLAMNVPEASSPSQIIRVIATCPEVQESVALRRFEKKRLNAMNEWIRMPVKGKVQNTTDKIVVLLQVLIGEQKNSYSSDAALRSEAERILQPAARVSGCVIAMVLQSILPVRYETAVAVLQVCRALQNKCLWDGPTLLRQIPGITVCDMRALNRAGIISLTKLSQQNAETLQRELGCRPAFVDTFEDKLRVFPRFVVKTEVLTEPKAEETELTISVSVNVFSMRGNGKPRQRRSVNYFILIGTPSVRLMACHVFSLRDGQRSITRSIPQQKDDKANGWVYVLVGCDSLCGTDVIKIIRTETRKEISQFVDRLALGGEMSQFVDRHALGGLQHSTRKLSVTKGRVTKKLSQAKLGQKVKLCLTQSPLSPPPLSPPTVQMVVPPQNCDDNGNTIVNHSREPDALVSAKRAVNEGNSSEEAKRKSKRDSVAIRPASVELKKETQNIPKRKEAKVGSGASKPRQTPARSESHTVLLPHDAVQDIGKEYDDMFRGLF